MKKNSRAALAACIIASAILPAPAAATIIDILITGKLEHGTLCASVMCVVDNSMKIDLSGRDFTAVFTVDTSKGIYQTGYVNGWFATVHDGFVYGSGLGPTRSSMTIDGVGMFFVDETHSYATRFDGVGRSDYEQYSSYNSSSFSDSAFTRDTYTSITVNISENGTISAPYGGLGTLFDSLEFGNYNRTIESEEASVYFTYSNIRYIDSGIASSYTDYYVISAQTTGNLYISTASSNPPPSDPATGSTPDKPFMPTGGNAESGFVFTYDVEAGVPTYYDPLVATGYDFLFSGASVTRAMFPTLLTDADGYQIYDLSWNLLGTVAVGGSFDFASPIDGFYLRGIDPVNMLDPASATAFVFGLVFDQSGTMTVTQIPFAESVPEPASWAMMIAGFGIAGAAMRTRRSGPRRALLNLL